MYQDTCKSVQVRAKIILMRAGSCRSVQVRADACKSVQDACACVSQVRGCVYVSADKEKLQELKYLHYASVLPRLTQSHCVTSILIPVIAHSETTKL